MKRLVFILAACLVTASVWAEEPCYEIKAQISYDLTAKADNLEGILFDIPAVVLHNRGKNVRWGGTLFYKSNNGEWVGVPFSKQTSYDYNCTDDVTIGKSTQKYYCSGDVAYNHYLVFLPYHAITHPRGRVDYKLTLWVTDGEKTNTFLKNKKGGFYQDFFFALDWPEEWPKEQKKAAPTKTVPAGYVDLGLPSGTLWSKKNAKDQIVESEYFSHIELDKMLEDCCVPTKEQFEELMNYCTWKWEGKGYTVTGQNGQSIYLPAAGHSDFQRWWNGDKTVDDLGVKGYYWTSTRSDANSDENYIALVFGDKTHIFMMPFKKNVFISVRLVRNSK